MLTFMLTCSACACYIASGGWGCGGLGREVNVHVDLRHMRMLRHVRGLGLTGGLGRDVNVHACACYVTPGGWGWGGFGLMLAFMLICGTCACYIPSATRGRGGLLLSRP